MQSRTFIALFIYFFMQSVISYYFFCSDKQIQQVSIPENILVAILQRCLLKNVK